MKKYNKSNNPLTWNWPAIIVWAVIATVAFNIFKFLYSVIC
jgi:hypothetical protein